MKKRKNKYTCVCGEGFSSRKRFHTHRKSQGHKMTEVVSCIFCRKRWSRGYWNKKRCTCPLSQRHVCDCGEGFSSKGALGVHQKSQGHKPSQVVSCIYCRVRYTRGYWNKNHHCTCPGSMDSIDYFLRVQNAWSGRRWSNWRKDRNGTPIEFRLSLYEYITLLERAGITQDDVGLTRGKYVLARLNDVGHYEMGNCRFMSQGQNQKERQTISSGRRVFNSCRDSLR